MADVFLNCQWFDSFFEFNFDKRYNSALKLIFLFLYYYDEFLTHSRSHFESDFLLEFFGNWILDEPTVVFIFSIHDSGSIIIAKWEFFSVVLSENFISIIFDFLRNIHRHNLIIFTDITQHQSRSKNFSANKLTIVNNI